MTTITLISSEKRDMLIGIAKMYYIEGLSQEQIAKEVHVSRPTVSRMLKQSVNEGIVQIRIDDVSSYGLELGKKLKQKFYFYQDMSKDDDVPKKLQNDFLHVVGGIWIFRQNRIEIIGFGSNCQF